jgi:hypothetical protein
MANRGSFAISRSGLTPTLTGRVAGVTVLASWRGHVCECNLLKARVVIATFTVSNGSPGVAGTA